MKRRDITAIRPFKDEPRGFSTKYWINEEVEKLVKFNNDFYPDQDLMEKVASDILKCLDINTVNVELGVMGEEKCCIIDNFLKEHEVLYEIDHHWAEHDYGDVSKNIGTAISKVFYKFTSLYEVGDASMIRDNYIKMLLGDIVVANEDRKLKNVSVVFNESNLTYSLSPSFDNGISFTAFRMVDSSPVIYIGNQYFEWKDVLNYLYDFHQPLVEEVSENLNHLVKYNLSQVLDMNEEIEIKKRQYIYSHVNYVNECILEKKATKTI